MVASRSVTSSVQHLAIQHKVVILLLDEVDEKVTNVNIMVDLVGNNNYYAITVIDVFVLNFRLVFYKRNMVTLI